MMDPNDKEYQNIALNAEDSPEVLRFESGDSSNIINNENNDDIDNYDGKRQKTNNLSSSSSIPLTASYLKPTKEYSINHGDNNNTNDGTNNDNTRGINSNHIDDDVNDVNGDEDGPTSSFENIIPPHLQSTFSSIGLFMSQTLENVQAKAVELNNSEAVKNMKLKTADMANKTYETSVKSWEQTREVTSPYFNAAMPYYEKSVDTVLNGVTYIADKTIDNVPTLNEVEKTIANTWESLSSAAAQIVGDSDNTSTTGATDSVNDNSAAAPVANDGRSSSSSSSSAFII